MTTDLEEVRLAAPEFRGAALELGRCQDLEVCLDGPAGTGKTFACLYKVHIMLILYPGSKAIVARKTNVALAGSAMATFREMLDPREGVNYYGGSKVRPAAFEYPNGSLMIVTGLDRREKIKSYEFDLAYLNEATEMDEEDIEYVRTRLRHGKMPYHQLIMDCNPDAPEHWLNQRMESGKTTRLLSRHEDNPRYFDLRTNDWTPEGRDYIFDVLGGLTGVLLERMRFGIWAAAFGTVYQGVWDRNKNVIDSFPVPKGAPVYLVLDFGYTHPFVCKWYFLDNDGRLYCYRELYVTKKLVEDLAKEILILSGWFHLLPPDHPKYKSSPDENADPLPREIITDHDIEDRKTFERHARLYTTAAKKSVSDGIQAVAARLRPAGDGKPRLLYFRNCLANRDPDLVKRKLPTCSAEEFNVYVWKKGASSSEKEEPVKEHDHGMDCDRYMVAHLDLKNHATGYFHAPAGSSWGR
jgi:hypothetical protein